MTSIFMHLAFLFGIISGVCQFHFSCVCHIFILLTESYQNLSQVTEKLKNHYNVYKFIKTHFNWRKLTCADIIFIVCSLFCKKFRTSFIFNIIIFQNASLIPLFTLWYSQKNFSFFLRIIFKKPSFTNESQ